jgi:hypothetical protein
MELNTFSDLLRYSFMRLAIGWIKRIIVAIRASANTFTAITIRACKSGIDGYFLHTGTESAPEIFTVRVISAIMPPGIHGICHPAKVGYFLTSLGATLSRAQTKLKKKTASGDAAFLVWF